MDNICLDIDGKLGYIAQMLNVHTAGKAYENFIVNAIYTKVDNQNLIPVTQQYVKSPSDPNKHYLLDLYFPQLTYGVEIDEPHHLEKAQKLKDRVREKEIIEAIGCKEDRISINNPDGTQRTYEEICSDINRVVDVIKGLIDAREPLIWETNEDRKAKVLEKHRFSTDDNVFYRSITEIYNICGGTRSGADRGREAKRLQKCYYRLNSKYILWVPILAIENKDGFAVKRKQGFSNYLTDNCSTIREVSDHVLDPVQDIEYKRVVFMRMQDIFGKDCIKFIGVFQLTTESNDKEFVHIYRRIATEVSFKDLADDIIIMSDSDVIIP